LQKNDGAEQSAEREVAERERSGERGYRNGLEREAAFPLLTLRLMMMMMLWFSFGSPQETEDFIFQNTYTNKLQM